MDNAGVSGGGIASYSLLVNLCAFTARLMFMDLDSGVSYMARVFGMASVWKLGLEMILQYHPRGILLVGPT